MPIGILIARLGDCPHARGRGHGAQDVVVHGPDGLFGLVTKRKRGWTTEFVLCGRSVIDEHEKAPSISTLREIDGA